MRRGCVLFGSFSLAVFFALYLLPEESWLWVGLGVAAVAVVALWRRWSVMALAAVGVSVALLWTAAYRLAVVKPWEELALRRTEVTFTLAETPQAVESYAARAEVYLTAKGKLPCKALVYGEPDLLSYRLGDTLSAVCDVSMADTLYGEETAVYTSKGIFLRLTARGSLTCPDPAAKAPLYLLPAAWGERLSGSIQSAFPADVAPFLAALTAGDRDLLPDSLSTDLSRAGVSHLVALSGMHICFLVGALSLFLGYDPKRRAVVCIPVILLFSLAVGASASVLRAAVLYVILLLAPLLGRSVDRWTSLSFALALLLFLAPYSARNMGLQLSFAAAAGLSLVAEPLKAKLSALVPKDDKLPRFLRRLCFLAINTFSATLGALSLTLPLSALYFGSVSLIQPLTNLLILPVASLLFALTLFTALMGLFLPAPAALLGKILAWGARYVLVVVELSARLPLSAVTTEEIYYPIFLLGVYALFLIALFGHDRRRPAIFFLCGGVLLCGAWAFTAASFHGGDLTLAVLDVGQGQSVLLLSAGESCLVDCGGNNLASAGDTAADYLQDRGRSTLDHLILTHYHSDHVNGLEELFRRVTVKELILPHMEHDEDTQIWLLEQAAAQGSTVTWIEENTDLTFGDATLRIYAPLGDGGANEEGLSLLAQAGDFEALITGDMNSVVEEMLVKYCALPSHVEVLVAGHHGSRYAGGDLLLDAVSPETAIISVGRNSYGHPSEETLARFASRGMTVYRTDTQGTITVTASAG